MDLYYYAQFMAQKEEFMHIQKSYPSEKKLLINYEIFNNMKQILTFKNDLFPNEVNLNN